MMLRSVVFSLLISLVLGNQQLTEDGNEFIINQKDYKPKKFTNFGQEWDDTWGFVRADYLPIDNTGYVEVCMWFNWSCRVYL
jgi:hypothetical protein